MVAAGLLRSKQDFVAAFRVRPVLWVMALLLVAMSAGIGSVHAGDLPAEDALPGVGRPAAKLSGKSNIMTWSYASSQTGIRPPWFSAVSAGAEHSCGLRSNGSVECWGNNGSRRASPPTGSFSAVSAGADHSCGLRSGWSAVCWGANDDRQATPPGGSFTSVSTGLSHSCGLRSGLVVCWGSSFFGQASPPAGSFSAVSAGADHSCGVRSDGLVVCWGEDEFGEATPPAGSFTAVSTGEGHSCGLRSSGGPVVCWGEDEFGEATPPAGSFTAVSTGARHSCGLVTSGSVVCWGEDEFGEATPPAGSFAAVSAGEGYSCGVQSRGSVLCWGDIRSGGASPPGGSFTSVSAGASHSCGLRSTGSIECWGELPLVVSGGQQVPVEGTHQPAIEALSDHVAGIFDGTGCEGGLCGDGPLQRWEMAVWLVRVLDREDPTAQTATRFVDVDNGSWWAPYTDRLASLGVTVGCARAPFRFCPDQLVTRGEMATFFVRAFNLDAAPAAGFADTGGDTHG